MNKKENQAVSRDYQQCKNQVFAIMYGLKVTDEERERVAAKRVEYRTKIRNTKYRGIE